MDIRAKIRSVLREHYGEFETFLEHEYEHKVVSNLAEGTPKDKNAWATYNQVMLELKHSIKDNLRVKELQYKLTENTDPNRVCIEVIREVKNLTPELNRLYHKIKNFI
jgi:molybdopterin converting factor small subunit